MDFLRAWFSSLLSVRTKIQMAQKRLSNVVRTRKKHEAIQPDLFHTAPQCNDTKKLSSGRSRHQFKRRKAVLMQQQRRNLKRVKDFSPARKNQCNTEPAKLQHRQGICLPSSLAEQDDENDESSVDECGMFQIFIHRTSPMYHWVELFYEEPN